MKRKMFFRLTAICLVAVSALIACTKDYGSDIKELQDKVDGLSQQVRDLNDLIKDGKVITSVKPEGNGTRVTFSNGDSFLISNGEDGEDGKDGTVWEIRDDYWWVDKGDGKGFQNSGKKAKGDPGNDGKSAYELSGFNGTEAEWIASLQGADGKSAFEIAKANDPSLANMTEAEWVKSLKGDKGDPGDYFVPCTDQQSEDYGKWIKVDGTDATKRTTLDELWLPEGTITAVWDPIRKTITFHNVENAPDGVVAISLATGLSSLAVIPEVWDATLGMPTAQVYALYPTVKEFERIMNGEGWNKLSVWNGANEANGDWGSDKYYDSNIWSAGGIAGFANMLWNSYLGATHQTNVVGYWDFWDITSPNFFRPCEWNEELLGPDPMDTSGSTWNWGGNGSGTKWEQTYEAVKALFEGHFLDKLSERLADVSEAGQESYSRQLPVSDLNFKYRVNPAGADLSGYTFKMLDRSVKALTKAEGENRDYAVVLDEPEFIGDDQVNIKGYIDYFKFWSDMPFEWIIKLLGAKVVRGYDVYRSFADPLADGNQYYTYNDQGQVTGDVAERYGIAGNFYKGENISNITNWLEANGVSFQTIVALEASKDGQGEGAVVSDWASVKMEFVSPYWTAFDHHYPTQPTGRWKVPHNLYNWWKGGLNYNGTGMAYENDLMKVSDSYDVAAHMRFADPYYGKLENLGFDVRYDYYLFCPATNAPAHDGVNARTGEVNLGTGEQVYDEDGNIVSGVYGGVTQGWGVYDFVDVDRTTGVVTVKEDYRSGANLAKVIGKFVFITADASIYNHATDTWYNSGAKGYPGGDVYLNDGRGKLVGFAGLQMYDEFAAQYCLQIIPDDNEGVEVTIDLGDIDYLALSTDKTAPAKDALDAVHMDLDTFSKIYGEPTVIGGTPAGYTGVYQEGSNDMFAITFDNAVALGNGAIKYCFTPSDTEIYPVLTYNIKWNVTIDWTALEPVLNPDYILYKKDADGNKTSELEPTDIVPDPVESYAPARPEGDFPYVDTIILVKGKRVDGEWTPQASIRENLYKYGTDIDNTPNVKDIAMSINFAVSKQEEGSAEMFNAPSIGGGATPYTYKLQEIKQLTPFTEDELSRDYVIDITATLENGTSKVVKAYILRFVCPMYIAIVDDDPDAETGDVDLYTHRTGWCSDRSEFAIFETGTNVPLVTYTYERRWMGPRDGWQEVIVRHVTTYALETYGQRFIQRVGNAEWYAEGDGTFGNNLRYESTTGWFYWNNNGNDLQEPKTLPYTVSVEIRNLATIKADGMVYIHKTAESPAAHNMEEPDYPTERIPSDDVIPLPTYETVYED